MKRFIFILLIAIFIFSCKAKQTMVLTDRKFEIVNIKNNKKVFVIYAKKNDSIFTILSIKQDCKIKSNQIKKGERYHLNLKRIYPPDNFISYNEIDYYNYQGIKIKLDKKNHRTIYVSKDLNGICINNDSIK